MTRWVTMSTLRKYIDLKVYDFESIEREIEQLTTPEYSRMVNKVPQYNLDKILEKYNQYRKIPMRLILREEDEAERKVKQQNFRGKDLEAQACKVFVCPNLKLIDIRGQELDLQDTTIQKAKDIARDYFKKTYHHPKYSSVRPILAACLYMASVIESGHTTNGQLDYSERRTQLEVRGVFGYQSAQAIRKWFYEIRDELCIDVIIT